MHELLPDGIDSLRDCPFTIFDAIQRALLILSWDEIPREERPPQSMWMDDEALIEHFDRLEADRKSRGAGDIPIEDPVENAAASSLIAG